MADKSLLPFQLWEREGEEDITTQLKAAESKESNVQWKGCAIHKTPQVCSDYLQHKHTHKLSRDAVSKNQISVSKNFENQGISIRIPTPEHAFLPLNYPILKTTLVKPIARTPGTHCQTKNKLKGMAKSFKAESLYYSLQNGGVTAMQRQILIRFQRLQSLRLAPMELVIQEWMNPSVCFTAIKKCIFHKLALLSLHLC